jgi:hypothetical protein
LAQPRVLSLRTYEGSGQAVHPDVVRGPDGLLWMAVTPYPGAREKFENPSVYRSEDGLTWREPAPRVNPIVPRPRWDHNCDPDLLCTPDGFALLYLETQRRKFRPDSVNIQDLRVVRSADGRTWSEPATVAHWDLDRDPFYLSPCAVATPGGWRVFLVWPKGRTIRWFTSEDLAALGEPSGTLETGLPLVRPWHLDVFAVDGGWVALLCARGPEARDNLDVDLWIGASPDLERWSFRPEPLLAGGDPSLGVEIVYRSTGLLEGSRLAVWWSGRTPSDRWVVGAASFDAALVRDLLAASRGAPGEPLPPPSGDPGPSR